jgi:hypothetical protein
MNASSWIGSASPETVDTSFNPLKTESESESELLYDWRFTANHFVLAPSPLRITTRDFFFLRLNPCGHSPYVTSLMRGWVCLLWTCFACVKCTYRAYSMLLKILRCVLYTNPLSVHALQSRPCLSYVSYATTAV